MYDYIHGRLPKTPIDGDLFGGKTQQVHYVPCDHFGPEAIAVMEAGKELWRYYHAQPNANPDAALYDIKLHFQGYDEAKRKMNSSSPDEHYTQLICTLREALKTLARCIEPKVYQYGFLMR